MVAFKVDENLPREVGDLLRRHGHDAVSVGDQGLVGHPDQSLAEVCKNENRALVTLDTDFTNIRVYPPKEHPGLVVLRVPRQDKATTLAVIHQALDLMTSEPLEGHLWIVEPDRVRIWKTPTGTAPD